MKAPLIDELLGPLHMHFLCARAAYADYLAAGRTFLFARSLRRINGSARNLLMAKGHLLPAELQADAAALIGHYDVWTTLWMEHRRLTRPKLDDVFAFANAHTYPKDSEARLEALYRSLAGQPSVETD